MTDNCAEAEHVATWREYMKNNAEWAIERTPNVYAAGFKAGMARAAVARPLGGDSITFRTKLLELDASHEDKLLRIAIDDDGFAIGRQIAPLLFEEVEITIRRMPSK